MRRPRAVSWCKLRTAMTRTWTTVRVLPLLLALTSPATAQEPARWGPGGDIDFHTFSIVAVDPATG